MTIERLLLPPLLILAILMIDENKRDFQKYINKKYRGELTSYFDSNSKIEWGYDKYYGSFNLMIMNYANKK